MDPKARELLAQMADTYKSLKSYSGRVEVKDTQPGANEQHFTIALRKPDQVAVVTTDRSGQRRVVTDGKNLYIVSSRDKEHYRKRPLRSGTPGFYQAMSVDGKKVLGAMFLGQSPYEWLSREAVSLKIGPPDTEAGVAVETVTAVLKSPQGVTATYAIGKSDRLLRRFVLSAMVNGQSLARTETHSAIKINPDLPKSLFTFTAPPGMKAVDFDRASNASR
jgi:hypothetical protein